MKTSLSIKLIAGAALFLVTLGLATLAVSPSQAIALENLTQFNAVQDCVPVKSLKLCARLDFVKPPVENVDAPFLLSFTELFADGTHGITHIIPNHKFTVDIFMPEMGHGSSPVRVETDATNAAFLVSDVYFVMSGSWIVRVKFVAVNGIPLEMISIPVTVP